jgi:hypothetical protein
MSLVAARDALVGGGAKLPYDAEVEWLSSGGTAYIDSGLLGCDGIGFEVTAKGASAWTQGYATGWRNDYQNPSDKKWTFVCQTSNQYKAISYCVGIGRLSNFTNVNVGNEMQTRFISYGIDTYTGNLTFEGDIKATGIYLPLAQQSPYPTLKVFAMDATSSSSGPTISSNDYKIARMVFTIKGATVRDYHPVRFTNANGVAEGAMYDRVSGQLFRNAGTGSFTIGADK